MEKSQIWKKKLTIRIIFMLFILTLNSIWITNANKSPKVASQYEMMEPLSADPLPSNISMKIYLTTSQLTIKPENIGSKEIPDLYIDQETYGRFYLYVNLTSDGKPLNDSNQNLSVYFEVFHQRQTEIGVELRSLFIENMSYNSNYGMFESTIDMLRFEGNRGVFILNITVTSVDPIVIFAQRTSHVFIFESEVLLPYWYWVFFYGTIIFLIGIIILIIRFFRRKHRTITDKISESQKRLKILNQKMIAINRDISREELIKEHEEIIRRLEEQIPSDKKNTYLLENQQTTRLD